jgi:hypothetical protein
LYADSARIDQLEEPGVVLHKVGDAVAGDAGLVIDDGDAPSRQPIEQARFSHIGTTDDDDLGDGHGYRD